MSEGFRRLSLAVGITCYVVWTAGATYYQWDQLSQRSVSAGPNYLTPVEIHKGITVDGRNGRIAAENSRIAAARNKAIWFVVLTSVASFAMPWGAVRGVVWVRKGFQEDESDDAIVR